MAPVSIWANVVRAPRPLIASAAEEDAAQAIHRAFLWLVLAVLLAAGLQDLVLAGWLVARVGLFIGLQAALRFTQEALGMTFIAYVAAWGLLWLVARPAERPHAAIRGAVVAMPVALMSIVQSLLAPVWPSHWPALQLAGMVWAMALLVVAARAQHNGAPAVATSGMVATSSGPWLGRGLVAVIGLAIFGQLVMLWHNRAALAPASQFDTVAELFTITPQGAQGPRVDTILAAQPSRRKVVEVWATWCGPCRQSLPHVAAVARVHADVSVVLVNIDDASRAASLLSALSPLPQNLVPAFDTTSYAERVGAATLPTFAVYDEGGHLVDVWAGFDRARLEHNLSGDASR